MPSTASSGRTGRTTEIISEHLSGLDLYLDPTSVESGGAEQISAVLRRALATLEKTAAAPERASAS